AIVNAITQRQAPGSPQPDTRVADLPLFLRAAWLDWAAGDTDAPIDQSRQHLLEAEHGSAQGIGRIIVKRPERVERDGRAITPDVQRIALLAGIEQMSQD